MFVNNDIISRYKRLVSKRDQLNSEIKFANIQLQEAIKQLDKISNEQTLILDSLKALRDVKPILSANSIEQCEKLANSALEAIFNSGMKFKYNAEESRFVLDNGEFETDLTSANGGGFLAVLSLVINIFLLLKLKKRRLLVFDEQFTQISDAYIGNFFQFMREITTKLGVDILAVTHDIRIEDEMADRIYIMEDGKTKRVK